MNRMKIQEALFDAISKCGYTPISTSALDVSTRIEALPAVWFAPLKIIEIEGRASGRIEYGLELAILCDCGGQSSEDKSISYANMEGSLLSVLSELSLAEPVILLDDITIEVASAPLTKLGDTSLKSTAKVVTYF